MEGRNTSQDPDYEGPTGHEKRLHKKTFLVSKKIINGDDSAWRQFRTGRYKLIPKRESANASRAAEEQ